MSGAWHLGIIGGSGLAAGIALEDAQEIEVASPFGLPSAAVTTGTRSGVRVTFLPRHGPGHAIPPHRVNYRANIDVLKRCGVSDVIALSAIGSLNEAMEPGHFVAVDQFIDRTSSRAGTFSMKGWLPMSVWPIRFARDFRECSLMQLRRRARWCIVAGAT